MTTHQTPRFTFFSLQHFSLRNVFEDWDSVRRGPPLVFLLLCCAWASLTFTCTVYTMQLLLGILRLLGVVFRTALGSEMMGTVVAGAWVQA